MSKPSIKKNFIYNMVYQVLAIIIPLITSPYLARTLGAEKIGINSWTYSVVFYFMVFAVLGVNNYGNRTVASVRMSEDKLSSAFCSIYACQMATSAFMIVLYAVYIIWFPVEYRLVAALQIFYVFAYAIDVTWFFYGLEEFRVTVARSLVVKLAGLVCIFIFIKKPNDLWKYTLIVSGTSFIGNMLLWPFVLKKVKIAVPMVSEVIPHIKPICILFIPVLAISIFSNMDKYMIGRLSNIVQSGYYENTDKIIGIPKAVITALGTVMLPRTANLIATGQEEKCKEYIDNTMVYTMMLGSAFVFGMAAVAEVFSVVFWGEEFEPCGQLIACMSPAILFSVFGNVIRTQYLIPHCKDKEYTFSLIAGAGVNLCVNLILIPRLGALGAVAGTVVSEFVMTCLQSYYVRKALDIKKYIMDNSVFVFFGAVMFSVVKIMQRVVGAPMGSLFLSIICGALLYSLMAISYLKCSRKENMHRVWEFILSAPGLQKKAGD